MTAAILALLAGLIIGSFLNVCIYRWPRDLSVVRPRSHCPSCEKTIAWHDNIPLVSYLMLGAKCRYCGARIPLRYPVVELGTGLLFFAFVWIYGADLAALKMCVFGAILVGLIFADVEERILPDELTIGGTVVGLVLSIFVQVPPSLAGLFPLITHVEFSPRSLSLMEAVMGAALPPSFLWLAGWVYEKVRHREGLGLGDVKLIAMVGSFLGFGGALYTLVLGSIAGSVIGYGYIKITGQDPATYELPFGTFLGAAALLIALTARQVLG
ncbi:MAG TPA: prepilin peptidase [Bryobacteraceae bacterium]|nr:prepilin peptidase [Bryobacteraceae bacterium]